MTHYRDLSETGLVIGIQAADGQIEELTRQVQRLYRERSTAQTKRANMLQEWHLRQLQKQANE